MATITATVLGSHAAIGTQNLVIQQTSVTRYVALPETAGGFTLPDPASRSSDRHFFGLAFPGVTALPAVIYYRTRRNGNPSFTVRINEATLTEYTFTDADPAERCWHELIPANLVDGPTLRAQDNELIFGITLNSPSDSITFGDVVMFYTSNESTIQVPIVITTKA